MEDAFESLSRWGAFLGLIPRKNLFNYTKKQTNPLICQPLFWWCLVMLIVEVLQGIASLVFQYINYQLGIFDTFPAVTIVSGFATVALYTGFSLIPRLVFVNSGKLTVAAKRLRQFNLQLNDQEETRRNDILRKRLKRFVLLEAVWVILYFLGVGIPGLLAVDGVQPLRNFIIFGFIAVFQLVGLLHVIITFAIFYLMNTSVALSLEATCKAFRKLIPTYIDANPNGATRDELQTGRTSTPKAIANQTRNADTIRVERLDQIKLSFSILLDASSHFNQAFWLAVLLFLCSKLFMCILTLYTLLYTIITLPQIGPLELGTHSLVMFLSDLGFFLIILLTAETPVVQWRNLLTVVSQCRTNDLSSEEKTEIQLFAHQISNSSFAFSTAGMFSVGRHLIPGVCASALTYLVVLLQSSNFATSPISEVMNATLKSATY